MTPEGFVELVSANGCPETEIHIGDKVTGTADTVETGQLLTRYYFRNSNTGQYAFTQDGKPVARAVANVFTKGFYMGNYVEVEYSYPAKVSDGSKISSITAKVTVYSEYDKATKSLKNDKSEAIDEVTLKAIKQQAAQSSKLTEEQKAQITAQAKASSVLTEEQKAQITEQAKAGATLTEKQKAQITAQAKASSILKDDKKAEIIATAQKSYPTELSDAEKALLIGTAQNVAEQTAVTTALKTAQDVATQTAVTTALITAQDVATQTAVTTALTTAQETATSTAMQTSTTVAKQVGNQAKKQFTNQVISQMTTLGNGLNQLTSGLSQLNDGASSLADGTTQVNDGANTLAEGIKTFNEEGIKKICNYINGNVKDLTTRIDKLTELSKEYNTFTMVDGENKSEVKFIMIIDAVKKIEENDNVKQKAVLNEEDK